MRAASDKVFLKFSITTSKNEIEMGTIHSRFSIKEKQLH